MISVEATYYASSTLSLKVTWLNICLEPTFIHRVFWTDAVKVPLISYACLQGSACHVACKYGLVQTDHTCRPFFARPHLCLYSQVSKIVKAPWSNVPILVAVLGHYVLSSSCYNMCYMLHSNRLWNIERWYCLFIVIFSINRTQKRTPKKK